MIYDAPPPKHFCWSSVEIWKAVRGSNSHFCLLFITMLITKCPTSPPFLQTHPFLLGKISTPASHLKTIFVLHVTTMSFSFSFLTCTQVISIHLSISRVSSRSLFSLPVGIHWSSVRIQALSPWSCPPSFSMRNMWVPLNTITSYGRALNNYCKYCNPSLYTLFEQTLSPLFISKFLRS